MSFRNEKPHSRTFGLSGIWLFEACKAELWRHCASCKNKVGRSFRETFRRNLVDGNLFLMTLCSNKDSVCFLLPAWVGRRDLFTWDTFIFLYPNDFWVLPSGSLHPGSETYWVLWILGFLRIPSCSCFIPSKFGFFLWKYFSLHPVFLSLPVTSHLYGYSDFF